MLSFLMALVTWLLSLLILGSLSFGVPVGRWEIAGLAAAITAWGLAAAAERVRAKPGRHR